MSEHQPAIQDSPRFGTADLSNCERELIHLAGSIQPHGLLLVVDPTGLRVRRASANAAAALRVPESDLLGHTVEGLTPVLRKHLDTLSPGELDETTHPFRWAGPAGSGTGYEGLVHRSADSGLVVELVPERATMADGEFETRSGTLASAASRISAAPSLGALGDAVVQSVRRLTGYDRVMLYTFDTDGHGEIMSEARESHLEPFLGLHYPASDIPQIARRLYVRNRVRVLVDVDYEPVPIVPRPTGDESHELDMSLCYLRSMSPVHLQYLRNMGVTATLVVSLVRSGELWGLIACHHYTPRNIPFPIRAGCELLAEMITTRITALESYAQAQAEVAVRRIEHRMIQATSADGDFRRALFDDPRTLLRPMNATGAALVYQGEIRTTGEVPSTPDLRRLVEWIARSTDEPLFQTSRLTDLDSELAPLASTASGVLSMEISRAAREYVLWFRKEQVRTVSWAGDPRKPVVVGDDPKELSPRRSFAVWKEQVRGTSKPWSNAEVAFARTLGASLVDLVVQVRGVRVLIVESQLERLRRDVALSPTPILVVDPEGAILLENDAFANLFRRPRPQLRHMAGIPSLFTEPERARQVLRAMVEERRSWSGQLRLRVDESEEIASSLPMLLRAHPVPGEGNEVLGYVLLLTDLRGRQEAEIARRRLRQAIVGVHPPTLLGESMTSEQRRQEALLQAILTNADVASVEVGDGAPPPLMTSLLRDVRASTRRAAHLSDEIQRYWRAEPERAEEGSGGGS